MLIPKDHMLHFATCDKKYASAILRFFLTTPGYPQNTPKRNVIIEAAFFLFLVKTSMQIALRLGAFSCFMYTIYYTSSWGDYMYCAAPIDAFVEYKALDMFEVLYCCDSGCFLYSVLNIHQRRFSIWTIHNVL